MALRQEQEDARTEVEEVALDVLRMQLPIQLPGLGHVNTYCLLDDRGAALIDPGLPGQHSWDVLMQRLGQAGVRLRDVHTVLVTHSHPDHYGGAGRLHAETGCRVIAHRAFRVFGPSLSACCEPEVSVEFLEGAEDPLAARRPRRVEGPLDPMPWPSETPSQPRTPWGSEPAANNPELRRRWEQMRAGGPVYLPRITHVVDHGSAIRLARRDWLVWFTPGHTADHICLHDPDGGVFLAGDHVLPSITPHISGLSDKADPLQAFYDSLEEVGRVEQVSCCLPAHGHPFEDLRARAAAIRRHHDERLERIKGISRRLGAASVQEISRELFPERSWGPMAESETYAHLEHLRNKREAERIDSSDGTPSYLAG